MDTAPQGKLLIVEDDVIVRALLTKRLRAAGHSVEAAEDGREGLRFARQGRPDLILTDWLMPEMDGPALVAAVREDPELRCTYVIVLTSKDDRADRVEGLNLGADDYLVKPWSDDELLAHVRAGLRIRALQQGLAEAGRKSTLLAMAATLGHEINNPLTALSGMLQLAGQCPPSGAALFAMLDRCQAQVDRIAAVVLKLRQLSNPQLTSYLGTAKMFDLRGDAPSAMSSGQASVGADEV
jgi:CheY-like chemotaxis protein